MNESPRDLLLILSEIERELGENITDPDLIEALEHGGIVEGAKRTWEHVKERYWKIHKKVIPSDYLTNGTSGIELILRFLIFILKRIILKRIFGPRSSVGGSIYDIS